MGIDHFNNSVILFPGQGSQSVGMLKEWSDIPAFRETWQEASKILEQDLWKIASEGPDLFLNKTEMTQPILLTASVACWRVISASFTEKESVAYCAGHSLGEYSALVCAQSLEFSEALQLVALRGRLMQAAADAQGGGAMLAVLGIDLLLLEEICQKLRYKGLFVSCANLNTPEQIVLSGTKEGIEAAKEQVMAAGAKRAILLSVSVPSHCELMQPAAEALEAALLSVHLSRPKIPVIHNLMARPVLDADEIRYALIQQLTHPVRWTESMAWVYEQGVSSFYECGPGRVLSGLMRRINKSFETVSFNV